MAPVKAALGHLFHKYWPHFFHNHADPNGTSTGLDFRTKESSWHVFKLHSALAPLVRLPNCEVKQSCSPHREGGWKGLGPSPPGLAPPALAAACGALPQVTDWNLPTLSDHLFKMMLSTANVAKPGGIKRPTRNQMSQKDSSFQSTCS